MKKLIYLLILGLFLSSCSHRVVRTGYKTSKSDYKYCEVVIIKDSSYSDTTATKIGEVKLGERGFSTACSEAHAIRILKSEACAINADLIVITEEIRPNAWSTCYRCNAEFYKYNSTIIAALPRTDESYNSKNIDDRVSEDRKKNTGLIISSILIGIVIGLILVL